MAETVTPPAAAGSAEPTREQILASLAEIDRTAEAPVEDHLGTDSPPPTPEPAAEPKDPQEGTTPEPAPKEGEQPTEGTTPTAPKELTKEELEAERKKLEQERAELEARRREFDAKAAAAQKDIESAEKQAADLERYAQEWDESGDKELAANARERAKKLRADVQALQREAGRAQFRQAQEAVLRQVVKDHPELSKPDSEMTKEMDALLRSKPALLTYPQGIADAAEIIAAKRARSGLQAVQQENEALKKQVADLQRRLQPGFGRTSAPKGEPSFTELPAADQRARLLENLRKQDAGA